MTLCNNILDAAEIIFMMSCPEKNTTAYSVSSQEPLTSPSVSGISIDLAQSSNAFTRASL